MTFWFQSYIYLWSYFQLFLYTINEVSFISKNIFFKNFIVNDVVHLWKKSHQNSTV